MHDRPATRSRVDGTFSVDVATRRESRSDGTAADLYMHVLDACAYIGNSWAAVIELAKVHVLVEQTLIGRSSLRCTSRATSTFTLLFRVATHLDLDIVTAFPLRSPSPTWLGSACIRALLFREAMGTTLSSHAP